MEVARIYLILQHSRYYCTRNFEYLHSDQELDFRRLTVPTSQQQTSLFQEKTQHTFALYVNHNDFQIVLSSTTSQSFSFFLWMQSLRHKDARWHPQPYVKAPMV